MPAAFKEARLESPFLASCERFAAMLGLLDSAEGHEMKLSDLERELELKTRELIRTMLQEHLDRRAPGEAEGPVRDADGVERDRTQYHERNVETVFGTVRVGRTGYGTEGTESLHPLDAALNLPEELYSLGVRRRVAEEAAKTSFDEVEQTIARHTGANVPKRQLRELVERAAQDFDLFYQTRRECAEADKANGSIVVMSVDGKGVVMRHEDLRGATQKAALSKSHKLSKRLSKGEKRNAKRMATVAVTYTIKPYVRTPEEVIRSMAPIRESEPRRRPVPELKRVWASLEKSPESVIEEAFQEARFRDTDRKKSWVALVDGNKPQIDILNDKAREHEVDLTVVLDFIHVSEYVWSAGLAFHAEGRPELQAWVAERLLQILRGKSSDVAAGMRRSATLRELDAQTRGPVDHCADYLLKYKPYLRYDVCLERGFPIATGVVEGACRHLVKDRMDLTGARWSLQGAEAVLRLRALRSCDDFDEYWGFHESLERQRNHDSEYADSTLPPVKAPSLSKKTPFRIIK
jgi:hypothetical protein